MADKQIQDLTPASAVQTSDRFVLEQSGQPKSLTGQILINDLAAYLDGHGGINDISYTPPSSGSLTGTLTITLADETTESFEVENGRGISDISFVESSGLVDTYQINYNDDSEPTTFTVTNGAKGDQGDNWYVHIKWSATEPTQDSDMSDTPDNWIGIYSGLGETAPTSYTEYTWFEYKGETGDTGNGIESISIYSSVGVVDTYRVLFTNGSSTTFEVTNGSNISSIAKTSSAGLTDTYTVTLTNGDTTNFTVSNAKSITSITPPGNPGLPGQTDRYIINFNNGDTTFFDVYNGTNGTGSVSLVDNIAPLGGDVPLLTFGSGAPTVDTPGSVKSRYFDTLNNQLYICVAVDTESTPNTYTWRGSSVTVDSVLSTTSTNPVQNAVLTAIIGTTPLDTTAQTLTEAVNEILDDISGFADNLADEYDATATYAVGDLCIYDNVLYRCNTAISTPEAWNSIHWTQTSVADDKVSKSGDTMTGDLVLNGSAIDRRTDISATTPSTTEYADVFTIKDENQTAFGFLSATHTSGGQKGVLMQAARNVNGSDVFHALNMRIDASGNRVVAVSDQSAWCTGIGAVKKTGDTMTGALHIDMPGVTQPITLKNTSNAITDTLTANSRQYIYFQDKNGTTYGVIRGNIDAGGSSGISLMAQRAVSGSQIYHGVNVMIDGSGNKSVSFGDAQVWRHGLGLGTSGAFPITIAQGGSGMTAVESTSTASQIATATSGFTINSAVFKQWGKVAQLYISVKNTNAISANAWTEVATLVSGKRPSYELGASLEAPAVAANTRIAAGGSIGIRPTTSIAANTTIAITATYLLP